jgi:hypothetical protein
MLVPGNPRGPRRDDDGSAGLAIYPLGPGRELNSHRQVWCRCGSMGEGQRCHEVLLEPRLDGRLDLLDPPDEPFDLAPRRRGQ